MKERRRVSNRNNQRVTSECPTREDRYRDGAGGGSHTRLFAIVVQGDAIERAKEVLLLIETVVSWPEPRGADVTSASNAHYLCAALDVLVLEVERRRLLHRPEVDSVDAVAARRHDGRAGMSQEAPVDLGEPLVLLDLTRARARAEPCLLVLVQQARNDVLARRADFGLFAEVHRYHADVVECHVAFGALERCCGILEGS